MADTIHDLKLEGKLRFYTPNNYCIITTKLSDIEQEIKITYFSVEEMGYFRIGAKNIIMIVYVTNL